MINKRFIQKLRKEHEKNNNERRQIISLANIILHDSKRVIFSLHRGEILKAEESLKNIEKILSQLDKKFGFIRLYMEGSYKAAVEEYVEAKTFYLVIQNKKIDKFNNVQLNYESYLGGICDLTGELIRRATNEVAQGNFKEVKHIKKIINDIMSELVEFNMTSYLRTKYDQARGNLRKIEQMDYDLKIRAK